MAEGRCHGFKRGDKDGERDGRSLSAVPGGQALLTRALVDWTQAAWGITNIPCEGCSVGRRRPVRPAQGRSQKRVDEFYSAK